MKCYVTSLKEIKVFHIILKMKILGGLKMNLEIKKFDKLTTKELYDILKVRLEVFIIEQGSFYNDADGRDFDSDHLMIKEDGKLLAYLRIIKPGIAYDECSLGRVLVIKEARGRGLAKKIVKNGIDHVINSWNEKKIKIAAKNYLREFYKSFGFKPISEVYLEDGITHVNMSLEVKK